MKAVAVLLAVIAFASVAAVSGIALLSSVNAEPITPYDPPPVVKIQRNGTNVVVSWNLGRLQWANSPTGAWTTVNDSSPHLEGILGGKMRYFRTQW
jgi:hypothetical protein